MSSLSFFAGVVSGFLFSDLLIFLMLSESLLKLEEGYSFFHQDGERRAIAEGRERGKSHLGNTLKIQLGVLAVLALFIFL